jgi:hypothetical protein
MSDTVSDIQSKLITTVSLAEGQHDILRMVSFARLYFVFKVRGFG